MYAGAGGQPLVRGEQAFGLKRFQADLHFDCEHPGLLDHAPPGPDPYEARGLAGDLLSGWAERVPAGAEVGQALASGVAGLLVAGVEVERVAVVGDLRLAVRPGGGSDQRGVCPAADRRLAARPQRRPSAGAGAQAGALRARVAPEQIERAALRIDQDRAEVALVRGADRRVLSAGGVGGRGRGGIAVATPATADDGQRAERYRCRDPRCTCWS